MEKITGKNNDLIKNAKKLLSSSKQRKEQGMFVLEGARLVFDVLNSFYDVEYFFTTQFAYDKYPRQADEMIGKAKSSFFISDDLAEKLSETQSSQGIFAVCKTEVSGNAKNEKANKLVALDNVQDPGNLGAILRTAEALGIDGVIVGGGCDIYNPKVLRASMGSILRIPVYQTDNLMKVLSELKANGMAVFGTSPLADAKKITEMDFSSPCICVIGNEANGISSEIINICNELITIPMLGRAESLNASVAASITMWEMLR